MARQEVWGRKKDSNIAPALSVNTERVWGFFYAKFFRRGCVIFLDFARLIYPTKLHFIDLPSMRQMKAETEIRLLHEFQANRSNGVFQNQDSSFYPPKRRLSEKLYKRKCL